MTSLRSTAELTPQQYLDWAEGLSSAVPDLDCIQPRKVEQVAVIGAGTMGAAIAVSLANAGLVVELLERDAESANAGRQRVQAIYNAALQRGRLTAEEVSGRSLRVRSGHDWSAASAVDLVIEAAFEDLTVKKEIFGRLDDLARPGAILATNTSYLDIDAIAAATSRRSDVVGLHFFSPAHVMRLLEVVCGEHTSPEVLATGMALGHRIGKLPIFARNSDGFIGNRIFAVYRKHAEYLLEDGASPQSIDAALVDFGFAMGPFAVSDMAGLDIAWAMRKRRALTRDPAERYVAIADRICESGRFGLKTGGGWYDYVDGKAVPSSFVEAIISDERRTRAVEAPSFSPESIQRRILAVMANEGAKVLREAIALRPSDIDLVFASGYGFPRSKGGPMYAADQCGLATVLNEVREAAKVGGKGSEPSELLIELADRGSSFAAWQNAQAGA